ncbi:MULTISPECIES: cobalt-precorrin-5B (C(1))-methyltransferase [unclassified Paenibacillus]|uniref:cobalt-precorrin-5B (C(1))-methyltransferase n=1 Tax=unclassified Paenibacillus TaxID=185978 RepID=UPI001AE22EE6|nr:MULTISPECIES: cobalt-precorrin-5B (C(1))-methyltransferase [unclassified Paenibacillus]MBP1156837.1 cobalt-precorrin-5B (C1)-methyltransferase [Paenibacillus sp. PvP091]MBP1172424.1 cobalt-precorrin-5B (C1)-methyltransferase [Paenibacillus sp. PvR098]MBP2438805.1 cobalt-precorrin-5B (C1)-methyltransferase [Paenibacillus sp. PvP052]
MDTKEPKSLRHGYTTGSCAAAAAQAALEALIVQEPQREATIRLPIGEVVTFEIVACEVEEHRASAEVIKDGGDDPDATHGARIICEVSWMETPGIELDGGVGVGRVTKPGLPVEVGQAAINPVPRKMIREAVKAVLNRYELLQRGVSVVVSVPDGEEIAKKTLNARLGILGGISILGTRGIVVPFSTAAYKASVAQAIRVAVKCGCSHIVLSTGGRTEKFGMDLYPELPEEAFVEMGDFVGFALQQCARQGICKVTLVGMMGKFSKVAQGVMMVHSKSAPVDFGFLARMAEEAGAPETVIGEIKGANTASQVGDMMHALGCTAFFDVMCAYCCQSGLQETAGSDAGFEVETVIISMKAELLGRMRMMKENG